RAERRGPIERLPSPPRRDGAQLDDMESELHDRLKRMRKEASEKDGIESAYLLNRHVLLALAKERPTSKTSLEALELLEGWQLDRFGDSILDTVVAFERDAARGAIRPRGGHRRRRR
ncbi:MAG: HRDC domain-containing protein, partial [Planctomycetota bacterium]|nr:HRDC domain-containing protein [Planctomycetota bacterium]